MHAPQTLFFNDGVFGCKSFTSFCIECGKYERLNIYCSADCEIDVQYADDGEYTVLERENFLHEAGELLTAEIIENWRYMKVLITNIGKQACNLKSQFIFYLDY